MKNYSNNSPDVNEDEIANNTKTRVNLPHENSHYMKNKEIKGEILGNIRIES